MRYATGPLCAFHSVPDTVAFDAVKQRLYAVSGCANYYELAEFLDTKPAKLVARHVKMTHQNGK